MVSSRCHAAEESKLLGGLVLGVERGIDVLGVADNIAAHPCRKTQRWPFPTRLISHPYDSVSEWLLTSNFPRFLYVLHSKFRAETTCIKALCHEGHLSALRSSVSLYLIPIVEARLTKLR